MIFMQLLLSFALFLSSFALAEGHREPYHAHGTLVNKAYSEKQAPALRVATFNMAAGRVSTLSDIAKALKALDADLIAIQEVDVLTKRSGKVHQPQRLAELTGLTIRFGRAIDFDGGQYGLAVASKHPILQTNIIQLPSEKREQRIALVAYVKVPDFETPITVFNTHLDTGENPALRLRQVQALNDFAIDTRGIKILMGDMNDVPNSGTYRELLRYWNPITDTGIDFRSWPAGNPEIQVDYVMTGKAQKWAVKNITVPQNNNNPYKGVKWSAVTDHLPIIVDMKMIEQ